MTAERPIELEDIDVLWAELKDLREECSRLDGELRSQHRQLAAAQSRQEELRKKIQKREAASREISQQLGCEEQDVLELARWRRQAKEQAKQAQQLQQGIEAECLESEATIAELRKLADRKGRPSSAKGLEAEETRRRREDLDLRCARLQLLRDFISGSVADTSALRELLADGSPPPAEDPVDLTDAFEELQAEHRKRMKTLVETSNSIIERKNHTWKRINKGLFVSSLLRPERCGLQEHPTIREVLDDAAALCRLRIAQKAPLPRTDEEGNVADRKTILRTDEEGATACE
ncbi:unnamed protein product [Effrenium voratum]|uniref:Uncharacterized protein n=1 Tax=Effrenium voratum TaxID=2562239 RepID=A0AA36J9H4_9DINO|nr:unnamed protein product [Effrenium voratum]CAJ1420519.1 unnamed protein product [Effrenium voratum]